MNDLDTRALRRIETAAPVEIIRKDAHASGLRIHRVDRDDFNNRRRRHDRIAAALGQAKDQQFLFKPRNLVRVELLQCLVVRGRIDCKVGPSFFDFHKLRRFNSGPFCRETDCRLIGYRIDSGFIAGSGWRHEICGGQAVQANLGDQDSVAALTRDNITIIDDDPKRLCAALAIAGADIPATERTGNGRGPVRRLGNPFHTNITPAICVEINVGETFQPRVGLHMNPVIGLIKRNRLEITDRNGRTGEVIDA